MAEKVDSKSIQCGFESHLPHFDTSVKVYGPYLSHSNNKKGRRFVVLVWPNAKKTTSYARYLMEQHLGYYLGDDVDVDHRDGNTLNDVIENLRVLDVAENRKTTKAPEYHYYDCPICGTPSKRLMSQYRHHNVKKGKAGPFCGRHCARAYQLGR